MSLVGYRNLTWLKARLLPGDMGEVTDYDADLSNIALGVAAHFDRFTGRTLRRTVDSVFDTAADQAAIVVTCYPIEELCVVELIDGGTPYDILSTVAGTNPKAGIVRFHGEAGADHQLIRVTSTGGYWCEDAAETMPAGATALPDEILQAWVQQCRAVCEAENIIRTKAAQKPDKKPAGAVSIETLTLLPGVKAVLQLHVRLG